MTTLPSARFGFPLCPRAWSAVQALLFFELTDCNCASWRYRTGGLWTMGCACPQMRAYMTAAVGRLHVTSLNG